MAQSVVEIAADLAELEVTQRQPPALLVRAQEVNNMQKIVPLVEFQGLFEEVFGNIE